MTEAAAAQLRRILALVPELADDEEHPIEQLAVALGTDRATLLGDLRALTERFDPGGFVDEGVALFIDGECVSLTSPHFRRPMRLTSAELHALELGLAMLERERPVEEHAAIGRARVRLRDVIAKLERAGDGSPLRVAALGTADAEQLGVLREAMAARRKVRLGYRRGDQDAVRDRIVAPYALVVASGMWYLVAYCDRSAGIRVFRLDRVERAAAVDESFTIPADFSIGEVVRERRVLLTGIVPTMTVRYSPRIARWIAEREGRVLDGEGALVMEHPLADVEWGVRHVLQYGPDAEVLAPESMRDTLRARLVAMRGDA